VNDYWYLLMPRLRVDMVVRPIFDDERHRDVVEAYKNPKWFPLGFNAGT